MASKDLFAVDVSQLKVVNLVIWTSSLHDEIEFVLVICSHMNIHTLFHNKQKNIVEYSPIANLV